MNMMYTSSSREGREKRMYVCSSSNEHNNNFYHIYFRFCLSHKVPSNSKLVPVVCCCYLAARFARIDCRTSSLVIGGATSISLSSLSSLSTLLLSSSCVFSCGCSINEATTSDVDISLVIQRCFINSNCLY